jgi:hypothetical protein
MFFGTPQRLRSNLHLKIETADYSLEHISVFKYLGTWFDSSLNWEYHIAKMHSKVSQRLDVLKRVRPYMSVETTKLPYNALVLPLLDHVDVIRSNCGKTCLTEFSVFKAEQLGSYYAAILEHLKPTF